MSSTKNISKNTADIEIEKVRNDTFLAFQNQVEQLKATGLTYIEAILAACEENGIDPEDANNMISPALRMRVTEEAANLRLIKVTTTRLPI